MRRLLLLLLVLSLLLCGCGEQSAPTVYNDPYDPAAAIAYSYQYAETRNPDYADFSSNCTNYISQILVAGGKQMDQPIAPEADKRITYHDIPDRWFSTSIHTNPVRWKEFSVSTSFCRTDAFVEYWCDVRGMAFSQYSNTMDGLLSLYAQATEGDVIILYDKEGAIAHLCLLVSKADNKLLVNANTKDYRDHNILAISSALYPQIGLLQIR